MSVRELVVLGTASQVPTRQRNHNGYLLRWDARGVLFDPGEGTQRQMTHAGVAASSISAICITHFHGDHCLGLPGVIQRLSTDGLPGPVDIYFPEQGQDYFERLRRAAAFDETTVLRPHPSTPGMVCSAPPFDVAAAALDHRVPTLGWRISEPDGVTMLPDRLEELGITGPDVGRLKDHGVLEIDERTVHLEDVSEPRRGQTVAFVMDSAWCQAAIDLAADADLLVCEATYLDAEADLAAEYRHLTAGQAGRLAAEASVRHLVLTHFSQRYQDTGAFVEQASQSFDGEITGARDLDRIEIPRPARPV